MVTKDEKYLKIGYTDNPDQRFTGLKIAAKQRYQSGITVLGFFPGHTGTEQWIQLRFAPFRDHGDWYRFTDEIRQFLKLIRLLPPDYRSKHSLRSAYLNG